MTDPFAPSNVMETQPLPDGSILEYSDEKHLYQIDLQPATGTSKLIQLYGLVDTTFLTEDAKDRGSRVHKAIHIDVAYRGGLDIERELERRSLVQGEANRVIAARQARKDLGITNDQACFPEFLTGNKQYGIATKLDLWVPFHKPIPLLVEWKSGPEMDWHRIQTGLQYLMVPPCLRFCVYLKEDGTYKIVEHKDRDSIRVATAIAAANGETLQWMRRRK